MGVFPSGKPNANVLKLIYFVGCDQSEDESCLKEIGSQRIVVNWGIEEVKLPGKSKINVCMKD